MLESAVLALEAFGEWIPQEARRVSMHPKLAPAHESTPSTHTSTTRTHTGRARSTGRGTLGGCGAGCAARHGSKEGALVVVSSRRRVLGSGRGESRTRCRLWLGGCGNSGVEDDMWCWTLPLHGMDASRETFGARWGRSTRGAGVLAAEAALLLVVPSAPSNHASNRTYGCCLVNAVRLCDVVLCRASRADASCLFGWLDSTRAGRDAAVIPGPALFSPFVLLPLLFRAHHASIVTCYVKLVVRTVPCCLAVALLLWRENTDTSTKKSLTHLHLTHPPPLETYTTHIYQPTDTTPLLPPTES